VGKAIKTMFLRQIRAVEAPLVGQNLQDTCRMILEVTQIATAIVRGQEHVPGRDQTDEMLPYSMMQDAAIKTAVESI
jgi:hypothetical protein